MKQSLYQYSLAHLKVLVAEKGWRPYTADQLIQWLYQKRVGSFAEMSNLKKEVRTVLEQGFSLPTLTMEKIQQSSDGTCKFLFRLADEKRIEAVFIPTEKRTTLCLSTQVGCAMACTFCRTGEMKLQRNLTLEEITGQVLAIQRYWEKGMRREGSFAVVEQGRSKPYDSSAERDDSEFPAIEEIRGSKRALQSIPPLSNLVFMGMGEPMANLPALLDALEILQHPNGCNFSKRHITVSTSGLVPKMYEFAKASQTKLAISLHAPNDSLRSELMPINDRYPLKKLMEFCRSYRDMNRRNRITFEYVMLAGVNDLPKHSKELVQLLQGIPSKINLIPFNPYPGNPHRPSPDETIKQWVDVLMKAGIQTNVRKDRGRDVLAACGQLAYLNFTTTSPSRM